MTLVQTGVAGAPGLAATQRVDAVDSALRVPAACLPAGLGVAAVEFCAWQLYSGSRPAWFAGVAFNTDYADL